MGYGGLGFEIDVEGGGLGWSGRGGAGELIGQILQYIPLEDFPSRTTARYLAPIETVFFGQLLGQWSDLFLSHSGFMIAHRWGILGVSMEQAFADLLVKYCLDIQPGQTLLLEARTPALPLVEAVHRTALAHGAFPQVLLQYPDQQREFLLGGGDWLDHPPRAYAAMVEAVDASLRIESEDNPLSLAGVEPARLARERKGWAGIRSTRASKRWCLTLYPTAGYAQQAGLSTGVFREDVRRALFLDQDDPVAAWRRLAQFQAGLIQRLELGRQVRIVAEGTDLTLGIAGRRWINSDGKRNMPSGEVFTGPLEDSAQGYIRFNLPVVVSGQRVAGVFLRFDRGKVVDASAEQGQDYLLAMLETDPGARFLGELGIGTNFGIQHPTGLILFDEKIGGSIHLALGRSYPETGGCNQSAIHWDLILDLRQGGEIWLDGVLMQRSGQFV